MNVISLIRPYKHHGQWVFDDPRVDLDKEPFVAGADTLIDLAIAHLKIPNADTGFLLLFSADPFPGHQLHLTHLRPETGGNLYTCQLPGTTTPHEAWLCPALLRYFDKPPKHIYAQLKPSS